MFGSGRGNLADNGGSGGGQQNVDVDFMLSELSNMMPSVIDEDVTLFRGERSRDSLFPHEGHFSKFIADASHPGSPRQTPAKRGRVDPSPLSSRAVRCSAADSPSILLSINTGTMQSPSSENSIPFRRGDTPPPQKRIKMCDTSKNSNLNDASGNRGQCNSDVAPSGGRRPDMGSRKEFSTPFSLLAETQRWNERDVANFFAIMKEYKDGGQPVTVPSVDRFDPTRSLAPELVTIMKHRLRKTERQILTFHIKMFSVGRKLFDAYGHECFDDEDAGKKRRRSVPETSAAPEEMAARTLNAPSPRTEAYAAAKKRGRVILYLTPHDSVSSDLNSKFGYNPNLELSLKLSKSVASVAKYLCDRKWTKIPRSDASISLRLCDAKYKFVEWKDGNATSTTIGDIHARLGAPIPFELKYTWCSSSSASDRDKTVAEAIKRPAATATASAQEATNTAFRVPSVPVTTPLTNETTFDRELFHMMKATASNGTASIPAVPRAASVGAAVTRSQTRTPPPLLSLRKSDAKENIDDTPSSDSIDDNSKLSPITEILKTKQPQIVDSGVETTGKAQAANGASAKLPHNPMPGLHGDGIARAKRIAANMRMSWTDDTTKRDQTSNVSPSLSKPRRVELMRLSSETGTYPNRLLRFDTTPPEMAPDVFRTASSKAQKYWTGTPVPKEAVVALMAAALEGAAQ